MKFFFTSVIAALLGRRTVTASNIGEGVAAHGQKTLIAETAVTARYTIAKFGSGAGKTDIGDASAQPLGIYTDEAKAGEATNVSLFGASQGTQLVRAGAAVAAGAELACDATGRSITATTGKYVFGRALKAAAAADDLIEFVPAYPVKLA